MNTYEVSVKHNHKGTRYPVTSHLKIEASSAAVASCKAIRDVKKKFGRSYREPVGATVSIFIIVTGKKIKEASNGRRVRDEQQTEPQSGDRSDA